MIRILEIFIIEFFSLILSLNIRSIGEYTVYTLISLTLSLIPILIDVNIGKDRFVSKFNKINNINRNINKKIGEILNIEKFDLKILINLFLFIIYIILCLMDKNFILGLPSLIYSLSFYLNKKLVAISLLLILKNNNMELLFLGVFSMYLSHRNNEFNKIYQEKINLSDSIRENKYLNLKIQKEEKQNYENNKKIAVLQERNRISRALHDSIGHTISSSLIQCEAIKVVSNESSIKYLDKLSTTLSSGMDEIRKALHDIHDNSFDFKLEVGKLVSSLREGIEVSENINKFNNESKKVEEIFLSIIKEGITNINKYSNANKVRINVKELPKHYTLLIKDNGSNYKENEPGIGLKGIKEALNDVGGILNTGFKDGFYIHATIEKDKI